MFALELMILFLLLYMMEKLGMITFTGGLVIIVLAMLEMILDIILLVELEERR